MSSTVTESAREAPSVESLVTHEDAPPHAKSLAPLRQLLGFLWPHKGRLIGASVALVFTAGAQLTLGYGVKMLIDDGFAGSDASGLYNAVIFMLII